MEKKIRVKKTGNKLGLPLESLKYDMKSTQHVSRDEDPTFEMKKKAYLYYR